MMTHGGTGPSMGMVAMPLLRSIALLAGQGLVSGLECKIDINLLSNFGSCDELKLNEIGQLTLRTSEPLVFDEYADARGTGSFILIDESTNETVGAGMIGRPPYLAQAGV